MMFSGRKKSVSHGVSLRVSRETSEESADAPKTKDSRLEQPQQPVHRPTRRAAAPRIGLSHPRLRSAARNIAHYFSAAASASSGGPPVLEPQVPFDPVTMKPLVDPPAAASTAASEEGDRRSDRSDGDSGKENEEDAPSLPEPSSSIWKTPTKSERGPNSWRSPAKSEPGSSPDKRGARSKLAEKQQSGQSRGETKLL